MKGGGGEEEERKRRRHNTPSSPANYVRTDTAEQGFTNMTKIRSKNLNMCLLFSVVINNNLDKTTSFPRGGEPVRIRDRSAGKPHGNRLSVITT